MFLFSYYVPPFVPGLVGEMGGMFALWGVLKRQSQLVNPKIILPQSFHPSHLHVGSAPGYGCFLLTVCSFLASFLPILAHP